MKSYRTSISLLIVITLLTLSHSYDTINQHNHIMAFYQQWSYMPVLHVYYNRHFSKSKQFQDFIDVIQQVQYQTKHYSKILFTNCEAQKSDENFPCKEIKRLNQNRMLIGYIPSSQFTKFGSKIMQSPPANKALDHFSDAYNVDQLVNFINSLLPNFYRQIRNSLEYQQFMKPKYSPKLIYASREGQIAEVVKQLGIEYFLRFDLGYVEDLTESVISQLAIKKYPSLIVLKYNYKSSVFEAFQYESNDFPPHEYHKLQAFLQKHALKQRRNDYVFHFIQPPKQAEIITVDNDADMEQTLDKIYGWAFVQQGPTHQKLDRLKSKYGLYYEYVHYLKATPSKPQTNSAEQTGQINEQNKSQQKSETKLYLQNQKADIRYEYNEQQVMYRTLNAEEFQSNSTIWLRKDYVVVGVRQKYGYICTIVNKALFDYLTACFIVEQESYQKVSSTMSIKFQIGFIVSAKKGTTRVQGNQIKKLDYHEVYRSLQYATRMKVKDIIDDFVQHPVKNLTDPVYLQQLCLDPYKKCIFYIYDKQKQTDQTKREYLQLQAGQFINQYRIYEVDLKCNKQLYKEIPQLQNSSGGLIAFHPAKNQYVYLKAKMTRSVIKKFLTINNEDKKDLPFKSFVSQNVLLKSCNPSSDQTQQTVNQGQTASQTVSNSQEENKENKEDKQFVQQL